MLFGLSNLLEEVLVGQVTLYQCARKERGKVAQRRDLWWGIHKGTCSYSFWPHTTRMLLCDDLFSLKCLWIDIRVLNLAWFEYFYSMPEVVIYLGPSLKISEFYLFKNSTEEWKGPAVKYWQNIYFPQYIFLYFPQGWLSFFYFSFPVCTEKEISLLYGSSGYLTSSHTVSVSLGQVGLQKQKTSKCRGSH